MPLLSVKITERQRLLLEALTKELDNISDTVRDLIEDAAVRQGISLDTSATLGVPSAAKELPLSSSSSSSKYLLRKEDISTILAEYADDTLEKGWKALVEEWWEVRNQTHRSKAAKTRRSFKGSVDALVAARHLYGKEKAMELLRRATTNGWQGINAEWAQNIVIGKTLKQVSEGPASVESLNLTKQERLVYNWYNSLPPGDQKDVVKRASENPEEYEAEYTALQKMGVLQ